MGPEIVYVFAATNKPAPNRGIQPMTTEFNQLRDVIAELLRQHWLNDEPTEDCADYDDARMASLYSFVNDKALNDESARMRSHLVGCPRCRYIYLQLFNGKDVEAH